MTVVNEPKALTDARQAGQAHGTFAASLIFDGHTSIGDYRRVLDLIETGDPAISEAVLEPSWLGGIWAGDPTPRSLAADLDIDPDLDPYLLDEACTAYEQAAGAAFWSDVERQARHHLEP